MMHATARSESTELTVSSVGFRVRGGHGFQKRRHGVNEENGADSDSAAPVVGWRVGLGSPEHTSDLYMTPPVCSGIPRPPSRALRARPAAERILGFDERDSAFVLFVIFVTPF
jgi:hypothetical protein